MKKKELSKIEINLLLTGIYEYYGFDFRNYSKEFIERRILEFNKENSIKTVSELQNIVLHDEVFFHKLMEKMLLNVTALYRDPETFKVLKEKVISNLRTYPFIRIWIAGCSTGEEIYSLAILLEEEGIYDRCKIYATDISTKSLNIAKAGIYKIDDFKKSINNYILSGLGCKKCECLTNYYTADYGSIIMKKRLKRNIVFSFHNLVTDGSFNEFNLILCRNVLIYFDKKLKRKVFDKFNESLVTFGYLVLGNSETLFNSGIEDQYNSISVKEKIYKKII